MNRALFSSIAAFIVTLAAAGRPAGACTNFLVTKGASQDGSTFISYSADSHTLYGYLSYIPAGEFPEGTMRDVYDWDTGKRLGSIKQVPKTYAVVGLMNERQVALGETTFGGRSELTDPTAEVDYGSLMFLALERAKTAREAIQVMTSLVEEYGYSSNGESFSVSDPEEAWILEMVGKGPGRKGAVWVARRIPDGFISAHANQPRIRQFPLNDRQNCLYAKDVISFAREKGYFSGKDEEFSFADAYAPLTYGALRFCEARVWSMFRRAAPSLKLSIDYVNGKEGAKPLPLWIKPDRKLSVRDVMEFMRDHFDGTDFDLSKGVGAGPYSLPYRWRPLTWEADGVKYLNDRSTSTQQTGFSFVAQSRSSLPDPVGGVFWFGVDDTYSTVYVPMYCGIREPPEAYAEGTGSFKQFSWKSAFWVFNAVANLAYLRYSDMIKEVRTVQQELEGKFLSEQPEVERAAAEKFKKAPETARQYLTEYSAARAHETVERWRNLWEFLLVKYVDGNVKDELGNVTHPPYPEEWLRRIAQESGDRYKVIKIKGEIEERKPVPPGYFHSRDELGKSGANVPKDFPFDKEKLILLPGTAVCGQPPSCCLAPKEDEGKLVIEAPKSAPDKCGAPAWLIRLPKAENREVLMPAPEE